MKTRIAIVLSVLLTASLVPVLSGCSDAARTVVVPEDTVLAVSLYATMRSDRVEPDETVIAKVERPVRVDGVTALDRGDLVALRVLEATGGERGRTPGISLKAIRVEYPHGGTQIKTGPVQFVGEQRGAKSLMERTLEDLAAGEPADTPGANVEDRADTPATVIEVPVLANTLVLLAGREMQFVLDHPMRITVPQGDDAP